MAGASGVNELANLLLAIESYVFLATALRSLRLHVFHWRIAQPATGGRA